MHRGAQFVGCTQDVFNRSCDSEVFCSQENWQEAILCLSQKFESHGFPSPCQRHSDASSVGDSGEANLDVITLINSSWLVLKKYSRLSATIGEMETQIRRLTGDLGHLRDLVRRQRDGLEAKNRVIHDSLERERKALNTNKESKLLIKHLREELRKIALLNEQRDNQCVHELKRKEAEMVKLKERLLRALSGNAAANPGGRRFARSNPAASVEPSIVFECISQQEKSPRAKWRTDQNEQKTKHTFYDSAIDDYENRLELLRLENVELRQSRADFINSIQKKFSCEDLVSALLPWKFAKQRFEEKEAEILQKIDFKPQDETKTATLEIIEKEKTELEKTKNEIMNSLFDDPSAFSPAEHSGPLWSLTVEVSSDENADSLQHLMIGRRKKLLPSRPRSVYNSQSPHNQKPKLRTGSISPVTKARTTSRSLPRRNIGLTPHKDTSKLERQYSSDATG